MENSVVADEHVALMVDVRKEGTRTGSLKWDWKKSEAAIVNQVVGAIRSEQFAFDKDAAKSLGMTTSTFNRKKDRAIAERVISREEWDACLAAARDTHGPGSPVDLAEDAEEHRAIAGQIEATRKHLDALVFDLEAVEHTIRLFDPDAQLGRAKPLPSAHAAFRGEMRRDVLAALRSASGPLTSLDIAEQVVAVRKLEANAVRMIRKRVGACRRSSRAWAIVWRA